MSAAGQLALGAAQPISMHTPSATIAALAAGADGPITLLVPGYTGSKEDFAPLLDPLAAQGFQALAIDLPGQYESPGVTDPAAYTPDALARVVLEIIASLGTRVHLLGHSFGGLVARAAVLAEPSAMLSLTLMCSGPAAVGAARQERIAMLAPVLAEHGMPGVYAAAQAAALNDPAYVAPEAELASFLQTRFLASSPAMLRGMGDAIRVEPDRVDALRATGVPVLVLHGENDDAWAPALQADMAERLDADYVIVPGAAHSPAVENPEPTLAALVAFWRAHG